MGVYIDMEIPISCANCPLRCYDRDDQKFCGATGNAIRYELSRPENCPLIEIPEPHGRLISADELIEFIENRYEITWKDDYEGGIKDACIDILPKPKTNAERIRAMTDEELAEWLKSIRYSWTCVPRSDNYRCADFKDDCHACWLDWLKREAE